MRLLILSVEFPPGPGGYGTLAYQAAYQLDRLGWQVTAATPQDHAAEAEIWRFNQAQPFPVLRLRRVEPPFLEGIYWLSTALRQAIYHRPDAILAVGRHAAWVGGAVSLFTRIPLAVVGVGTEFLVAGRLDRRLTRWAFGRAELLVAISDYAYRLAQSRGFDLSRARVILPGADAGLYTPGLSTAPLRERLELGRARVLLTVGQLSRRKAQDVVIRALPQLLRQVPDLVYIMVGLPTLRQELAALAHELGVEDHVRFIGQVPQSELRFYYNLADVFILVSRLAGVDDVEGFGIVVLEAALCGKPAVVSSDSGLVEAVLPGETALVVPPGDPTAAAGAAGRLLLDDHLRLKMGEAAYRYALQNAAWEKRMRAYHAALVEIVTGEPCDC